MRSPAAHPSLNDEGHLAMFSPPLTDASHLAAAGLSFADDTHPPPPDVFPGLDPEAHPFTVETSPEMPSAPATESTASSVMGSPSSLPGHQLAALPDWSPPLGLGLTPNIVQYDSFAPSAHDFHGWATDPLDELPLDFHTTKAGFVDPSILSPPYPSFPQEATTPAPDATLFPHPMYPLSPALSPASTRSPLPPQTASPAPFLGAGITNSPYPAYPYPPPMQRRSSVTMSHRSFHSHEGGIHSGEEAREKGRCPHPDCGKTFKDLKAHMLTHQTERPEKCPIQTCEYHTKGFARKYDKNRHTLTHYKGTMVCGFCPGSGSAAEKSFNRADVFKRHLTSVHAVEQTPPNSRKRLSHRGTPASAAASDATGKCSTCSATFSSAQDFYEHLDDCVLRIVQQEEPSAPINAARLAEVADDPAVRDTLISHSLLAPSPDADETDAPPRTSPATETAESARTRSTRPLRNPVNGVSKPGRISQSASRRAGGIVSTRPRGKGAPVRSFPGAWGYDASHGRVKKRTLSIFNGPRRLWKDDTLLDRDHEVRLDLPSSDGGNTTDHLLSTSGYPTNFDVATMQRAEAVHQVADALRHVDSGAGAAAWTASFGGVETSQQELDAQASSWLVDTNDTDADVDMNMTLDIDMTLDMNMNPGDIGMSVLGVM